MSGSAFDNLQTAVFDAAKSQFGYECSWAAVDGGASFVGIVLFNNPTQQLQGIGVQYDPTDWKMEYPFGDFDGLFDRVRERNSKERVEIDGKTYFVTGVEADWDGKTYKASLKPTND